MLSPKSKLNVPDSPFWTTIEVLVFIHITTTKQVNYSPPSHPLCATISQLDRRNPERKVGHSAWYQKIPPWERKTNNMSRRMAHSVRIFSIPQVENEVTKTQLCGCCWDPRSRNCWIKEGPKSGVFDSFFRNCMTVQKPVYMPLELILNWTKVCAFNFLKNQSYNFRTALCTSKMGSVFYQAEEIFSIIYMFYHIEE